MDGTFRRRKLPHYDVAGMPIFITACLDGSISAAGLSRIRGYRVELEQRPCPRGLSEDEWEHQKHKLLFKFVDELLDHHSPVRHLEDERQGLVGRPDVPFAVGILGVVFRERVERAAAGLGRSEEHTSELQSQ